MAFDIVVMNGRIIDGTGNPWIKADVAIKDEKIAKIGRYENELAGDVIDANGLVVTPGFIDIHTHSEIHLIINPNAEGPVRQGITTIVGGNCGWSAAPVTGKNRNLIHSPWWPKEVKPEWETFREFFKIYKRKCVAINVANYIGHGTVRSAVMGWDARLATKDELDEMKAHLVKAMVDGVFGLSSGLTYPPGCWSDDHEVVELCKVVAKYGGFHATHDRGGPNFKGKIEAIKIGKKADIPVHISHIETHKGEWNRMEDVLKILDDARAMGQEITYDICTMKYTGTWLAVFLPRWAKEGGAPKMLERIKNPDTREKIKNELLSRGTSLLNKFIILTSRAHPEFIGMNVSEISEKWVKDPFDVLLDLLRDEGLDLPELDHASKEHVDKDLQIGFRHPSCMPITDSWFSAPYGILGQRSPHPRGYSGFSIVIRKWVRGETRPDMPEEVGARIVTLEDAIRKMTSLPAQRLGLNDRGLLREGMQADIVIFDADKVTDMALYPSPANRKPHSYPEGMHFVIVNGNIVIDQGEHTGSLPGTVLRGPGYKVS